MKSLGLKKVAAFYGVLIVVGLVLLQLTGGLRLLWPASLSAAGVEVGLGVGVGLVLVLLSWIATEQFRWAERLAEELRALLGEVSRREALLLAALSGVGEELIFRGVLQPAVGLWIASLIFGVLHVGPNVRFAPWPVMAFLVGLVLGWLLELTDGLWAPILAHATVNFINIRRLATREEHADVQLGRESRTRPYLRW